MIRKSLTFRAADDVEIFVYQWFPEDKIKAAVNIIHGMAETAARYERFAGALTENGYAVYAADQRGHGRTVRDPQLVGKTGTDALNKMLTDIHRLSGIIREENPEVPLFLFGHSMGSFLAQGYIARWGGGLQGAILSGAAGPADFLTLIGQLVARLEMLRKGEKGESRLLYNLSFGSFNKQFHPVRTAFDWLSRDNEEVDKYIADPFCDGIFPAAFFYDLFKFWRRIHRPAELKKVPVDLPLYFFSGTKDPVGNNARGVRRLIEKYKQSGIKDLNFNFYEDGRHEMLNEVNRDIVAADIIRWLDGHL